MDIKEINNKEIWENFISGCEEKTFLDSWNWGEFQKTQGEKIWRWGIYSGNEIVAVVLAMKIKARRGTFLFVPHGPVIVNPKSEITNPKQIQNLHQVLKFAPGAKSEILNILLPKLKEISKEEKASFIRISPILARSDENANIYKDLGFIEAPIHIHPEVTWELDITPTEDELLNAMRKTTRYLIRQGQKNKDIEIVKSKNIEYLEKFNEIYRATARRHNFTEFSLKYLENQFSCFLPDNEIQIFFGKYKGKIVSSAIFVFWQGKAFYHHSGSLSEFSKIPVSYLLQWEAIKEAKNRGCKSYNFWGIVDGNIKNHPWAGLSLFKMGFGGYKKEYVKTQDLPLKKRYWFIRIFEKLRKIKRRL
jgi:peptidoglycan pentaglycine glycine transferase (the first glycine)